MEVFPKIQTLFKRFTEGPNKGRMIEGAWTTPELEYLAGNQWSFTEKVDGTNIRVHLTVENDDLFVEFGGRTDNAVIPTPLLEALEATFDNGNVATWMLGNDLTDVLLFGEGYGPKIQGGGKYRDEHSFVLFDVKIGNFWLSRDNVDDIASKLGIDSVPVIGHGTLYDAIDMVKNNLKSQWGDFEAEGIVARPVVPLFDRKGDRIITKIKAVDFR